MNEIEEAAKLIEADRNARLKAASAAIEAILKENRCDLVAIPQIQAGQIIAVVQIVAR
jgi:hypothetical protein